jgi:hypothetical protein
MSRNFDQFCSRFLSESLRNSWNPERFMRVVPRDLFNEAKILSMVSKFAKDVNQGKMPEGFIGKLNKKWTVALSENGELYISGFDLTYKGQKADLTMNYNAGKVYRFPLQITVEDMDLWSVSIYDENGELDSDMEQFEEAPGPGKIDIPDWSLTIEELKRLGKIGLNNNLNDDSGIVPKDDSRGFADSFSNGKIGNIKINNSMTENFDTFVESILTEKKTPAWQRKEGKNPSGGLNKKGVASYRRANPGSKLKTAVTTKPSKLKKGSKAAKRRKSFCKRMTGMKKKLTSAKTARDPDSRINKSLRKWNC